ncbi:ankyrin [Hypoxylon cercidicola]|nr:ankyrin [Hypoxylon cercidicola]
MASKTRKIPQGSWDHHKETILSLYLTSDLSVDELVHTMEKDHGFSATLSQFEAQLRVWNARKNLKRHEWEVILQKIDQLSSRGIQARVVISGHPVSMDRVHRARRHCKSDHHPNKRRRVEVDSHMGTSSADGSVMVEVQNLDGNWTLHTDVTGEDVVSGQQPMGIDEILELVTQEDQIGTDSAQAALGLAVAEPLTHSHVTPELSLFHTPDLIPYNLFLGSGNDDLSQTMDFQIQISQSHEPQEDIRFQALESANTSPQSSNLAQLPWGTYCLEGLPFERFERELASRDLRLITRPSSMHDLRLLSPTLVTIFLADAVAAMTEANGKSVRENFYGASLTLKTLDTILPTSQQRHGNNSIARSSQEALEVELCRILLFSTANAFTGMAGVPLELISGFLEQNSNITTLLPRLFQDKSSPVTKGLAESLFLMAVESGDNRAIRFFLRTGLIDVNALACSVKNQKYTPLERVAELQNLEAIRELLLFRPDVNWTLLTDPQRVIDRVHLDYHCRGALGRLIKGSCPIEWNKRDHRTFSSEYLDTVDSLIQAGAEVRVSFIRMALTRFVRMDLAKKLLNASPAANHSVLISNDMLDVIAANFTDKEAKIAFAKILSDCEQKNCKQCLIRHSEKINWAFVNGAKRGYVKLVRAHFKYVKSPAEILAAAIQGGNHELVRFILDQGPDMHAPATDIIRAPREIIDEPSYTTPLAVAIGARNETIARELEAKGALEHLGNGHRFTAVLSAAARVGDVEYMKKLMLLHPRFNCYDMTDALFDAMEEKQEDAVRFLLDAGAEPGYPAGYRAQWNRSELLTIGCELGDKSLFSDLISSYPDAMIGVNNKGIHEALQSGNMDKFNLFFRLGRISQEALDKCLCTAVIKGDSVMVRHFLELGVDPLQENIFTFIQDDKIIHPDILRLLFEYVPSTKTCTAGLGTEAVTRAIRGDNTEALELLINCKAIDFKSTIPRERHLGLRPFYSPLGLAVERDAESGRLDFPLTKRLLNAGCDINGISHVDYDACDRRVNKTPLLKAIETRSKPMVQFLVERGAFVSKEAIRGIKRTPIQAAAEVGSLDIVELLLQRGADVNENPAPFHGGTALQCAAMSGNCNVAAFLINHGANMFAPPSTYGGRWPIEGAAEYGRLDMIQFLWNASLVGFPVEQCRRAMELAKMSGHGGCVDLIRELAVSNGIMPTLEGPA